MRLPQLVREIIDYYIYFRQWKAKIRQLNAEYKEKFRTNLPYLFDNEGFTYNWRSLDKPVDNWHSEEMCPDLMIYNPQFNWTDMGVAELPSRYFYSNTNEQLKSIYF